MEPNRGLCHHRRSVIIGTRLTPSVQDANAPCTSSQAQQQLINRLIHLIGRTVLYVVGKRKTVNRAKRSQHNFSAVRFSSNHIITRFLTFSILQMKEYELFPLKYVMMNLVCSLHLKKRSLGCHRANQPDEL